MLPRFMGFILKKFNKIAVGTFPGTLPNASDDIKNLDHATSIIKTSTALPAGGEKTLTDHIEWEVPLLIN
jgi:hypothetical protein